MEEGEGEGMEEGEGVEEEEGVKEGEGMEEGMEEWAVYHHRCRLVHPRLPMENEQVVVVPQVVALKTVVLKTVRKTVQAVGCTAGMNHHHHHHHGHSLAPTHTTNHNHHHCNHHCNHRPLPPLRGPSFTTNSFPIAATTVCLK